MPAATRSNAFHYREATRADHPLLASFGCEMFLETWGALYRAEDIQEFLDRVYTHQAILADFDLGRRFWLAEHQQTPIGYLKTGKVGLPVDSQGLASLELKQLYVTKAYHGTEVAHRLMGFFLDQCRDEACEVAYISCYSQNQRALAFYAKYGFQECGKYIFRVGLQEDDERILRRYSPWPP